MGFALRTLGCAILGSERVRFGLPNTEHWRAVENDDFRGPSMNQDPCAAPHSVYWDQPADGAGEVANSARTASIVSAVA